MPTYDYACRDCGEQLEVVQSFKDDPLTECPNCGGTLKKKFHAPGVAFKGSGFYKNDSRGSKASSSAGSSDSKSESKSESKSDAKSESSSSSSTSKSSDSSSSSKSDSSSSTTNATASA